MVEENANEKESQCRVRERRAIFRMWERFLEQTLIGDYKCFSVVQAKPGVLMWTCRTPQNCVIYSMHTS